MGIVMIECDTEKISDGVHKFSEMYEIRDLLFIALMRQYTDRSFRSMSHNDGSFRDNMFICGVVLPTGKQVMLHMKIEKWDLLHGIPTPDKAPEWDGHGTQDTLNRFEDWLEKEIRK